MLECWTSPGTLTVNNGPTLGRWLPQGSHKMDHQINGHIQGLL